MGFSRRQDRREERREDRGPGDRTDGDHRYKMRQKVLAIGDDFWIENGRGEKVYKIDGKALRVRQTLIFEDRNGNELLKIQERMLRVKDSMEIEDPQGKRVALVRKALITPLRERWSVDIPGGSDLEVQGNIPVSYTHLDVYKRQIMETRKNTLPSMRCLSLQISQSKALFRA